MESPVQRIALFTLPAPPETQPPRPAADWRHRFVSAGIGALEPEWNRIRVVSLPTALWLIPCDPVAGDWLVSHLDAIAGVVADTTGVAVPLEVRERAIGVRHQDDLLWAYRLPAYVVQKSPGDWSPHFEKELAPALRDAMARKIERGLRKELSAWGKLPAALDTSDPFLVVAEIGRATAVPAISAERAHRDKPMLVLVRRYPLLLSYWRLEGELFVGPLASLGYGRLLRIPAPEVLDRYTQKALLALPSSASEIRA